MLTLKKVDESGFIMSSLIITVICLMLFVVLSVCGGIYVDSDVVNKKQKEKIINTGFIKLISAYYIHKLNNGGNSFDASNWSSFVEVPFSLKSTSWSYDSTSNGDYFCLSGLFDKEETLRLGFSSLSDSFNSVFVNNYCGATSSDLSFTKGETNALTIWLNSNYVSESIVLGDSNIIPFTAIFENETTGEEILDGETLNLTVGNEFFINIELLSDLINLNIEPVSDIITTFVCSDGSEGCVTGLNRRLKIITSDVFTNRNLSIKVFSNASSFTKNINISSNNPA
jgi:hypothetical protein